MYLARERAEIMLEEVAGPGRRFQFVVADPDGYLWRPFRDLGTRPHLSNLE